MGQGWESQGAGRAGGRSPERPASLARLEIRVMFEELLRRLPDIALVDEGQLPRTRSNFIRGITRMPVEFSPQPA